MRDLFFIAIAIVCSLIAIRKPVFGVLAFVCFGFLNPQSFTYGLGRTFPAALLIAGGTIVGYLFWNERKRFPWSIETLLLLALWGMFAVSTAIPVYPEEALNQFLKVSKVLLMIIMCLALLHTEERLKFLAKVIALSIGFYALKGGAKLFLGGGDLIVWGPDGTYLANSNAIGLVMAVNAPFLHYLSKEEAHAWLRRLMQLMFAFSYPAVMLTYSRGAWLGLAAATLLIVLRSRRRFTVVIVGALCLGLAVPLLMYLPEKVIGRFDALINYETQSTAQERIWSWEFCKRVASDNLAHGAGFDFATEKMYQIYYPEHLEYWSTILGRSTVAWSCHSSWLTIVSEHGIPGMAICVALIAASLLSLRRIRRYGSLDTDYKWAASYANMIEAGIVAYLVTGSFIDAAYYDLFYYLVAVAILLKDVIRQQQTLVSTQHIEGSGHPDVSPLTPASTST